MSEWVKKYSIFINAVILILVSIIGWSMSRVVAQVDRKADADMVNEKFKTVDVKINSNKELIKANEKTIEKTQTLFLGEIRMIRQELQLKENR